MNWRIYRPGMVVGHSLTGEMDKVDGPYYFFETLKNLSSVVPEGFPLLTEQGGLAQYRAGGLCGERHRSPRTPA